ncbi:E3 ubiquitin-protein ligase Midline-1-like [Mytilus californianus]|uniref:E3 ubiquitin-protein ligase Midline-1-like n=1 Tax=Mytilus californianus TaxID=6549 RepID=UPI002246AF22|nr:E3 ubiquitin-protein ligase Midline-1-like [Mytilus californianus]
MAKREKDKQTNNNELLTCSICLETFKTPKCLPCLHTFCKVCIHTYIQSSVDKENIISFKCPVCRSLVSVGERSINLECWVDELSTNHLIISMIDRQAIQKLEKLSNACELSNVNQNAVSWCTVCQEALCSMCENCHRKFKVSANHKILTLQETQRDTTASFSGLITCDVHSNKFVEIFCVDHGIHCCTVCATVKHRKCEKVVELGEAAAGIKEAKQTTEFLEVMMQWKTLLDKSIQDTQKYVCAVEIMGEDIFSEIENLKRDLIEHVNKVEKAAKEELFSKKKGIVTELTDRMIEMSSLKSTVDNWYNILSTSVNDGSEIQCLIEFNKLVPKKEKIESEIKNTTSNIDKRSLIFKKNSGLEKFQEHVRTLGEVRIVNSKESVQSKSMHGSLIDTIPDVSGCSTYFQRDLDVENLNIQYFGKIKPFNPKQNTQSKLHCTSFTNSYSKPKEVKFRTGKVKSLFTLKAGDNNGLAVSGIFIKESILLSNTNTKKILKFNHTGTFLCDVQLNSEPYDITKFRDDDIAVSFPNSKEIRLMDIHTMTMKRKIQLSHDVCGLRYLDVNDQFIMACENSIVWSNATSGVKIKKTKTSGQTYYICAYESNSYVYADGSKCVSCSENGSIRFTYKSQKLYFPRGIDVDFRGNLYVCFYGSNNIHQISTSGELMRKIPCEDLGTVAPWFIRFKQNSNKFLVTSLSSGKVVVAEII